MHNWNKKTLGEVCQFRGGSAFPLAQQGSKFGVVPFIKVSDFSLPGNEKYLNKSNNWVSTAQIAEMNSSLVEVGSTVFAKIGEGLKAERLRLISRPTAIDNNLMSATAITSQIDPDYLYYLLSTVHLASWAQGSALPFLRQKDLDLIPISIPTIEEQQKITEVLRSLDNLIFINAETVNTLSTLRGHLVSSALMNTKQALPLTNFATFINGKNFTKNPSGSGRPVIRTSEIRRGPTEATVWSNAEASNDYLAVAGDILFVWSGSLMVERWLHQEGLVNQHIFKVTPNPGVPAWLVMGLIVHQMPWYLGLAKDKATTMGHIQRVHLDALVPVPSGAEIRRLDHLIKPIWDSELQLLLENQQLSKTRDELLPLLLSGAIKATDVAA